MSASSRGVPTLPVPLLRDAIGRETARLSLRRAAAEIAISPNGLRNFLNGSAPRSATRAKFERWLAGRERVTRPPNVGQLVRERHGREAVLVGFSTYTGTVTAASDWGAPLERKRVRPALQDSYEALFHQAGLSNFLLPSHNDSKAANALHGPRLERAIGVIYLPKSERISHYFQARLPEQFDAVLHFDETLAIEPLDRTTQWEVGETEIPETYPSAL